MDEDKVSKSLERLSNLLERRSKAWNVFLTGVLSGVGTVIGAALIGTILVGLIASNLSNIPVLRDVIPEKTLEQYISD